MCTSKRGEDGRERFRCEPKTKFSPLRRQYRMLSRCFRTTRILSNHKGKYRISPEISPRISPSIYRTISRWKSTKKSDVSQEPVKDAQSTRIPPENGLDSISPVPSRTHNCDQLRSENESETVVLCGWIQQKRLLGSQLAFLQLRDSFGMTQVVLHGENHVAQLQGMSLESVLCVRGQVKLRPADSVNMVSDRSYLGESSDQDRI